MNMIVNTEMPETTHTALAAVVAEAERLTANALYTDTNGETKAAEKAWQVFRARILAEHGPHTWCALNALAMEHARAARMPTATDAQIAARERRSVVMKAAHDLRKATALTESA